jgi:hypothetical protein
MKKPGDFIIELVPSAEALLRFMLHVELDKLHVVHVEPTSFRYGTI